ncbi:hypothetical protein COP1_041726 [Malus domestica]
MGGTRCSTGQKLDVFASRLPPGTGCSTLLLHHKPSNPNASLPSNPDEFELDFGLCGLIPLLSVSPIEAGFRTLQLNNGFGWDGLANPEARPNSSTFIFFFFPLRFPTPFSTAIAGDKDFHFLHPSSSEAFQPRRTGNCHCIPKRNKPR